jgi:hypothetical protein
MAEDFFFETTEEPESSPEHLRTKITRQVRELQGLKAQKEELEEQLKEIEFRINALETRAIPDTLTEFGLSEVKTADGLRVSTKIYVGALPKEAKQQAYQWIDQRGDGGIIKRNVSISFQKGESEAASTAAERLRELGFAPQTTLDIHHSTFGAYVREQIASGVQVPLEQWGVFYGHKAVVK